MTRIDVDASRWDMPIKADLIGGPGGLKQLLSAGEPLNPQVVE
jgi:acetyl-CoA synthetase